MAEPMTVEQGAAILDGLARIEEILGQLVAALAEGGEDDGAVTPLDGGRVGGERDMTRSLG